MRRPYKWRPEEWQCEERQPEEEWLCEETASLRRSGCVRREPEEEWLPYMQRATRGTESDSGDEGAEDDELPSVFTVEELTLFQ